ncbi:TrmH family RNA methyltransferase [Candidatus Saccharibacteria bacterium]|nr:TrmH family RNA methyltransferase [Candidatus Saccharibacteria bacterium]MBR2989578.1 TrmH family RNA methyltransferase [Candidatus Saccharibacteria bacterium]
MEEDTRNLVDEFKGLSNEAVFEALEKKRSELEVAIFNVSHDFNAGTIVRNANNFNAAAVHIVGRRKYNRRGAMCTDKYLTVKYWGDITEFLEDQRKRGREVVAVENNVPEEVRDKFGCIEDKKFAQKTTLVFGSESDGLPLEMLEGCDDIREISSYGSTRSVNVGVASGIAMYEWAKQWLAQRI